MREWLLWCRLLLLPYHVEKPLLDSFVGGNALATRSICALIPLSLHLRLGHATLKVDKGDFRSVEGLDLVRRPQLAGWDNRHDDVVTHHLHRASGIERGGVVW